MASTRVSHWVVASEFLQYFLCVMFICLVQGRTFNFRAGTLGKIQKGIELVAENIYGNRLAAPKRPESKWENNFLLGLNYQLFFYANTKRVDINQNIDFLKIVQSWVYWSDAKITRFVVVWEALVCVGSHISWSSPWRTTKCPIPLQIWPSFPFLDLKGKLGTAPSQLLHQQVWEKRRCWLCSNASSRHYLSQKHPNSLLTLFVFFAIRWFVFCISLCLSLSLSGPLFFV